MKKTLKIDPITEAIIGGAIAVHRQLGPGLLERTYELCLEAELRDRGLKVQRQVAVPVRYRGAEVDCGYRVDMLVDDQVMVELKAVQELGAIHVSQLLTYLKFASLQVGLLFNFNVEALVAGGWKRVLRDN